MIALTNGFIFKEKPFNRKLDINKVEDLNIDKAYYRKLKQGEDVINEKGEIIRNELVTLLGRSTKSYAFCMKLLLYLHILNLKRCLYEYQNKHDFWL